VIDALIEPGKDQLFWQEDCQKIASFTFPTAADA
jgi:hypothetical protein